MSFDARTLYELLPAVHRLRDARLAEMEGLERGPLEELVAVLAEQIGVVEENLEQLYDDLFIETCAPWVIPYIGDLISYESLHGSVPAVASPRAEVAHTIALRRRKGTALVLEQLARDVTGWHARVVEFFERLAATQYMNHPRPHCLGMANLRDVTALERIGTAFDPTSRTVDVRRIESGRGRHNIPNVGLFLWRIDAYSRSRTPAVRVAERRYRVSPLGHDLPLYHRPVAEDEITHLAEPVNVPEPLSRRGTARHLARYYGDRPGAGMAVDNPNPSLMLWVDDTPVERDAIAICNLSDDGLDWAHVPPPAGVYAVDPVLGRVALPAQAPDPAQVLVTWHEGFSAAIGGGEYERGDSDADIRVPEDQPTIAQALAVLGGSGVIVISDSGRYEENLDIAVAAGGEITLRADNGRRPVLVLSAPVTVSGGADSGVTLDGVVVTGQPLRVPDSGGNQLARLSLRDCTLVPGLGLNADGSPQDASAPSLVQELADTEVRVERSIIGAVRCHERAQLSATDSIIDATGPAQVAYAAPDNASAGGAFSAVSCTVIGKVNAQQFDLISNVILLAELAVADSWTVPVRCERKQVGCVRFSFVPWAAITPARYRCQPDSDAAAFRIAPHFTSLRYGTPAYCQLTSRTPVAIRRGADDESEMGVFHHLEAPQRETNLRIRLREYLRVGLQAGIFFES